MVPIFPVWSLTALLAAVVLDAQDANEYFVGGLLIASTIGAIVNGVASWGVAAKSVEYEDSDESS